MVEAGKKAPSFKAKDQNGNTISLSDFKGKKIVLFFYPEDDTPTCTLEVCNLRDNYSLLTSKGYVVVGVSPDDVKSHKRFENKFHLPFALLADPERKIIDAYGSWGQKQMFGNNYMGVIRQTFVIDEKGRIEKIFRKVLSKNHAQQILAESNGNNLAEE
ncbi:MAG: thioredoxin-dependent thiol peroxidase [Chitinophagales bacterium]|nr:thioredoxin-dependent thiol peroxidase [Chitinophagales bacterium]